MDQESYRRDCHHEARVIQFRKNWKYSRVLGAIFWTSLVADNCHD